VGHLAATANKLIAKASASGITHDMPLLTLIVLWAVGCLVVFDLLVMWFWSEFPAHVFRFLWKCGWRRDQGFWPEDVESFELWTKEVWSVWINIRMPVLGELLTCPVCLSRHLAWITACVMILFTGIGAWPALLAGVFTWPGVANRLLR